MPWLDGMITPFPECPYPAKTPDMMHKMFESFPSPRVFKTHLPYDLLPKPCSDQASKPHHIYVMRNPKDTIVSWYHHNLKLLFEPKPTWDEFFESFLKGEGMLPKEYTVTYAFNCYSLVVDPGWPSS